MPTEHTEAIQTSRIDYFSNLPYDVLDPIFEAAYSSHRPTGPLSKKLLPFYEKSLYRSIHLLDSKKILKFLEHLLAKPRLGPLVENMNVKVSWKKVEHFEWLSQIPGTNPFFSLFPLLPLLRHLDVTQLPEQLGLLHDALQGSLSLPNLRSLAVSLFENGNLSTLDFVAGLPLLSMLYIQDLGSQHRIVGPPTCRFEGIIALSVSGKGIRKEWLEEVVRATPNLSQFSISESNKTSNLATLLKTLPSSLKALDIVTSSEQTIDLVLPRFQALEQLKILGHVYSSSIHESLLQLPALSHVELSYGQTDATQLIHLLTSIHRPLRLRFIILNHGQGWCGRKAGSTRRKGFDWNLEKGLWDTTMESWKLPGWGTPNLFNYQALKQLIKLAEERGIAVSGPGLGALRIVEHYFIELNNRSVLRAYYQKDFEPLVKSRERALEYDYPLPEINFDSLGPELEIIETPLPNENWFILSLKNKEEEQT
ncbi:hypothetical protein JCM3765_005927 [Sporobolomyces pararoseus]